MLEQGFDAPRRTRDQERVEVARKFGANLRSLRLSAPLSQAGLAKLAEVHTTEISLIERGHRAPRVDTLLRLVKALGVTANDLLDGIEWIEPAENPHPGFYDVEA